MCVYCTMDIVIVLTATFGIGSWSISTACMCVDRLNAEGGRDSAKRGIF